MSQDGVHGALDRRQFLKALGIAASATIPLAAALPAAAQSPADDDPSSVMRSPQAATQVSSYSAAVPPVGVIALNRMAFGPKPGDLSDFNSLGSNSKDRLYAYIDQQLDPAAIDDSACDARLAEAGFTTLEKSRAELWSDHIVNYGGDYNYRTQPMREVDRAAFVRAIYSRRQLVEVLADFWHDHFNVYGWEYPIYAMFAYYDRAVIRANLLGNFRTMLGKVAKSTTMLYYLDNYTNTRAGPNENWAREVFELHALGAENYLGVRRQSEVPTDEKGRPVGYVDDDVYEATRCFTGWTVANSDSSPGGHTGLFLFRDDWHDRFQKTVLGAFIPADQETTKDGEDVLDLLASHPGTGRHICRKLCRRLIADNPPESVVHSAASLFSEKSEAPDQLAQVVRHILRSTEFRTTWGQKTKRPFEAAVGAMRATKADFEFSLDDSDGNSFLSVYGYMGQQLYRWPAPDGYPDFAEAWQSTTPMVMRWRLFNWLVEVKDDADQFRLDLLGQTPQHVKSPNKLVDFWTNRILGRSVDEASRQQFVDFMAQGRNPTYDLPLDVDTNIQDRLRSLVALILTSPEFQWR